MKTEADVVPLRMKHLGVRPVLLSTLVMLRFNNPSQHSHSSRDCFCGAVKLRFPCPTILTTEVHHRFVISGFVSLLNDSVVHLLERSLELSMVWIQPKQCQVASADLRLPSFTRVIKTDHTV